MEPDSINSLTLGKSLAGHVVYGHGWARDHRDFIPIAESLEPVLTSVLLDFPGFGESPKPQQPWSTRDYADATAEFIRERFSEPVVWVGHSFGGRVGLRLAKDYPELISGMVLIGCAGIPRKKSFLEILNSAYRKKVFKLKKQLVRSEEELSVLEKKFGSSDYIFSQELGLRETFLKTISEDQTEDIKSISIPISFIYGANDNDTPPEMGRRMASLIPKATFFELDDLDHITVLDRGRHLIAKEIKTFLKQES